MAMVVRGLQQPCCTSQESADETEIPKKLAEPIECHQSKASLVTPFGLPDDMKSALMADIVDVHCSTRLQTMDPVFTYSDSFSDDDFLAGLLKENEPSVEVIDDMDPVFAQSDSFSDDDSLAGLLRENEPFVEAIDDMDPVFAQSDSFSDDDSLAGSLTEESEQSVEEIDDMGPVFAQSDSFSDDDYLAGFLLENEPSVEVIDAAVCPWDLLCPPSPPMTITILPEFSSLQQGAKGAKDSLATIAVELDSVPAGEAALISVGSGTGQSMQPCVSFTIDEDGLYNLTLPVRSGVGEVTLAVRSSAGEPIVEEVVHLGELMSFGSEVEDWPSPRKEDVSPAGTSDLGSTCVMSDAGSSPGDAMSSEEELSVQSCGGSTVSGTDV